MAAERADAGSQGQSLGHFRFDGVIGIAGAEGLAADRFGWNTMIFLPLMLLWASRPMQFSATMRWALLLFIATVLAVGSPHSLGLDAREHERHSGGGDAAQLSREGTRLSGVVGTFHEIARRWTFTAEEGDAAYRLLENNALERINRAMREDPSDNRWEVTGVLTEYMDENFLLIRHAERASQ